MAGIRIKLRAAMLRYVTSKIPIPGKVLEVLLRNVEVAYPILPVTIEAQGALFEIRSLDDIIQRTIYFLGRWELKETLFVKRVLRAGDVFIDIGANLGYFTVLGGQIVGPNGLIVAFEPFSLVREHLQKNVSLNGLMNVRIEPIAVADKKGTSSIQGAVPANLGLMSLVTTSGSYKGGKEYKEQTETIDLDSYVRACLSRNKRIRLIKIDVEHGIAQALKGMDFILSNTMADYVLFEVNDDKLSAIGTSSEEVCQKFDRYKYKLYKLGLIKLRPLRQYRNVRGNVLAVSPNL